VEIKKLDIPWPDPVTHAPRGKGVHLSDILDGIERDLGQEYQQQNFSVNIPLVHGLDEGDYFFIVEADATGHQPEINETNNTNADGPVYLTYPELPDLRVSNLGTAEASPHSGGPLTIQWDLLNAGNGSANSLFRERLVITDATSGQVVFQTQIGYDPAEKGPIRAGESVLREHIHTLPDGPNGAGQFQISVTTDWNDDVFEYIAAIDAEQNNTASHLVESTLAPYPDLIVAQLATDFASVRTGDDITLTWRIENTGDGIVTSEFSEYVRVINTDTDQTLVPFFAGLLAVNPGDIRVF